MCAVSLAVLDTLSQPEFLAHVQAMGALLRHGLQDLSQQWGLGEVRGEGLLLALELGCDRAPEVVRACQAHGLLVNAARPHCLRLMPRLNSTPAEIAEGLHLLETALRQILQAEPLM
jgi:acetylornithine/N-succinyldiaminopimelate aminotransferase